jgi:hypothetical protein
MLNTVAAVQHVWWWAAEDGEEGDAPLTPATRIIEITQKL